MKVSQREKKFTRFLKIEQEGVYGSNETARKLGISINTLYNWRNLLRSNTKSSLITTAVKAQPSPSFTRVSVEPQYQVSPEQSFIEIIVGNTIVMRIPSSIQTGTLHAILDYYMVRGNR
jgi:Transposase.